MPKGAALSEQSSGESVSHFGSIRVRVNGTGNLKLKIISLDEVREKTLASIPMQTLTRRIPLKIVNYVEQRAQFQFQTTEIDEVFRINRIIVYMGSLWTTYPE